MLLTSLVLLSVLTFSPLTIPTWKILLAVDSRMLLDITCPEDIVIGLILVVASNLLVEILCADATEDGFILENVDKTFVLDKVCPEDIPAWLILNDADNLLVPKDWLEIIPVGKILAIVASLFVPLDSAEAIEDWVIL